jgi:hypothetical protein
VHPQTHLRAHTHTPKHCRDPSKHTSKVAHLRTHIKKQCARSNPHARAYAHIKALQRPKQTHKLTCANAHAYQKQCAPSNSLARAYAHTKALQRRKQTHKQACATAHARMKAVCSLKPTCARIRTHQHTAKTQANTQASSRISARTYESSVHPQTHLRAHTHTLKNCKDQSKHISTLEHLGTHIKKQRAPSNPLAPAYAHTKALQRHKQTHKQACLNAPAHQKAVCTLKPNRARIRTHPSTGIAKLHVTILQACLLLWTILLYLAPPRSKSSRAST